MQKKAAVSRALRELNNCQGNITEMERLIQTMPVRDREFFTEDVVACRDSQKQLLAEFNKFDEEVKRLILIEEAQRNQGLDGDLARRTNQQLTAANSNFDKAIGIGGQVIDGQNRAMGTLLEDREHLKNIDNTTDKIIDETEKANKFANTMLGRAFFNGFIAWIIVGILAVTDGALIWFFWFSGLYK